MQYNFSLAFIQNAFILCLLSKITVSQLSLSQSLIYEKQGQKRNELVCRRSQQKSMTRMKINQPRTWLLMYNFIKIPILSFSQITGNLQVTKTATISFIFCLSFKAMTEALNEDSLEISFVDAYFPKMARLPIN